MRRSGTGWTVAFFIAPAVALLVALNVVPFGYALYMSFYNWSLAKPGPPNFLGWFNYEDLLLNERFHNSLIVSAQFVVLAVSIELVLGTALAFLFSAKVRGMATLRKWSIAPVMVTPLVAGLVWFFMFNETYGTITWIAYELGLGRVPFFSHGFLALLCIVIADVWQWTPLVMLIMFAALQSIPEYVYEAGRMDGLSERQMLWRITLAPAPTGPRRRPDPPCHRLAPKPRTRLHDDARRTGRRDRDAPLVHLHDRFREPGPRRGRSHGRGDGDLCHRPQPVPSPPAPLSGNLTAMAASDAVTRNQRGSAVKSALLLVLAAAFVGFCLFPFYIMLTDGAEDELPDRRLAADLGLRADLQEHSGRHLRLRRTKRAVLHHQQRGGHRSEHDGRAPSRRHGCLWPRPLPLPRLA